LRDNVRMANVFEPAASGRAKCRGCGRTLAKGEWRFGERLPNPFGEGEVTHWFHPACAAYKRPEAIMASLGDAPPELPERADLEVISATSVAAPRLTRIDGAERAPSGQARCRQCKEPIEKGAWRIRLVFHEEGTFSPGGFIHLRCRKTYFENADVLAPVLHFSPLLGDADRDALRAALNE
jgi:hypothetical protein